MKDFFNAPADRGFLERIRTNTTRYLNIFSTVIDAHMPQPNVEFGPEDYSAFDNLMQQRRQNQAQSQRVMADQGLVRAGDAP